MTTLEARQIQSLRAQIDELEEKNRLLKEALAPSLSTVFVAAMLFSSKEADIVSMLLAHPLCTKESIMVGLYSNSPEWPEPKIIDVFICRIRARFKRFNLLDPDFPLIKIETIWGRGYRMPKEQQDALREVIASYDSRLRTPLKLLGAASVIRTNP